MSPAIYQALHLILIIINIWKLCISQLFLSCLFFFLFFSFTVTMKYYLSKELKDAGTGLLAAPIIEYISWSMAVLWDNERIAIFCILLTYYTLKQQTLALYIFGQVCPSFSSLEEVYNLLINSIPFMYSILCTLVGDHRMCLLVMDLWGLLRFVLPEHHFLAEDICCVFASHPIIREHGNLCV